VNNTGNANLTIEVNATNLIGETDNSYIIYGGNFSAHIASGGSPPAECNGSALVGGRFINVSGSILSRGNLTTGGGVGQEEIYYCLKVVGALRTQVYSTPDSGAWTIRVVALLVAVGAVGRRGERKRKKKLAKLIYPIIEELRARYGLSHEETFRAVVKKMMESYGLGKEDVRELFGAMPGENIEIPATIFVKELGALEALCKYMKENLGMNYHEIAAALNRDERTIWASYKKAKEKAPGRIEALPTRVRVPVSVFKDEKLSVFEAVVSYLKEKGMKYSEIASALGREQRNVWTIYSRAVKKKGVTKKEKFK
jgi:hypothetical protein